MLISNMSEVKYVRYHVLLFGVFILPLREMVTSHYNDILKFGNFIFTFHKFWLLFMRFFLSFLLNNNKENGYLKIIIVRAFQE